MSSKDSKRYYWLKLNENFFEDDTVTWLEEQDNGKDYVIFYLKLCLKSISNEGYLVRYVGEKLIPYDVNALSKLTNTSVDTVAVAMKTFLDIGLVTRLETGEIYMNQINEMIGNETESARKMRKKRTLDAAKKEQLEAPSHCDHNVQKCDHNVQKCDTEIEKEKELEKELELELEVVQNDKKLVDNCHKTPTSFEEFNIFNFIQANFNRVLSPIEMETLNFWLKEFDKELIQEATRTAVMNNKYNLKYIEAILKNWERNNITTVAMAREEDEKWRSRQNKISKSFSSNRKETLPDWAEKEMTETPLGHEEEMQLKKQLEELRAK